MNQSVQWNVKWVLNVARFPNLFSGLYRKKSQSKTNKINQTQTKDLQAELLSCEDVYQVIQCVTPLYPQTFGLVT